MFTLMKQFMPISSYIIGWFSGVLLDIAKAEHLNLLRLQRNEPLARPRKIIWVLQDQSILNAQKLVSSDPPQISTINFLMKMSHRCATFHSRRRNEDITTIREEDLINLDANPTDIAEGIQQMFYFLFWISLLLLMLF